MPCSKTGWLHLGAVLMVTSAFAWPLAAEDFARADHPRPFIFPRDHGNHSDFKTEWWYVTGTLRDTEGKRYGFQATWFRSALVAVAPVRASNLGTRDIYFFHGAVSDIDAGTFSHVHRASRGAGSWAKASATELSVQVLTDDVASDGDGGFDLNFRVGDRTLGLHLRPQRAPLPHGASPGLSKKGAAVGQASYYYSLTRLATSGTISGPGGERLQVEGQSWLDHEFGSNQLQKDQAGWDWFSAALDEGTDVMLYLLRRQDGSVDPASAGTLRFADGRRVHLRREDFVVTVLERWKSPHTQATYPSHWRIRIPAHDFDCVVRPLLPAQELTTEGTTQVSYWEGLCEWQGQLHGQRVSAAGYVELVGYAGAFLTEI